MLQNFSAKGGGGYLHFLELVFSERKLRKGGGVTPLIRNFFAFCLMALFLTLLP